MDKEFTLLSDDEVLFLRTGRILMENPTFKVSEFLDMLAQLISEREEEWSDAKEGWFTEQGVRCEALRFGNQGWQRGRVRIRLEFSPERPELAAADRPKLLQDARPDADRSITDRTVDRIDSSVRSDVSRPDPVRAESPRSENIRPESTRPESGRSSDSREPLRPLPPIETLRSRDDASSYRQGESVFSIEDDYIGDYGKDSLKDPIKDPIKDRREDDDWGDDDWEDLDRNPQDWDSQDWDSRDNRDRDSRENQAWERDDRGNREMRDNRDRDNSNYRNRPENIYSRDDIYAREDRYGRNDQPPLRDGRSRDPRDISLRDRREISLRDPRDQRNDNFYPDYPPDLDDNY